MNKSRDGEKIKSISYIVLAKKRFKKNNRKQSGHASELGPDMKTKNEHSNMQKQKEDK